MTIAVLSIVISLLGGFASQIEQSFPKPAPGTLFAAITGNFTKAVSQALPLLGPLFLLGFAVIAFFALGLLLHALRGE